MTFNPQPKPTKRARVNTTNKKREKLVTHRRRQYQLAKDRDDGWCTFCYFLKQVRIPAVDVHHVYGRGDNDKSWKEKYFVMLCTCRKCHPPAIHSGPGTSVNLAYVEKVLCQANDWPINRQFKRHEIKS